MKHYQFSNLEITDQFISVNVYKNNNYVMKVGAEITHLEHTADIDDCLYKEFREFALNYLNEGTFKAQPTAKILNMWDFKKRPI